MTAPIKTIVAAVDMDDTFFAPIIEFAVPLSEQLGARLNIIHIWPRLTNFGNAEEREEHILKDDRNRRKHERKLKRMVSKLSTNVVTAIPTGDPAEQVVDYARNRGADTIIVGSYRRKLYDKLLTKSAVSHIVRNAECSVLLITPPFARRFVPSDVPGSQ